MTKGLRSQVILFGNARPRFAAEGTFVHLTIPPGTPFVGARKAQRYVVRDLAGAHVDAGRGCHVLASALGAVHSFTFFLGASFFCLSCLDRSDNALANNS